MRKLLPLLFLLCLTALGQRVESVATFNELVTRGPSSLGALRNLAGTRRAEVSMQGYHAAGDGGAARWRWTTDTSNTNAYGGRVSVAGGAWELIHDGEVNAAAFGAVGRPQTQIPPYWNQESFSTAIGTNDFTAWAQFVTPTFSEFPQGLIRVKTQTSFARLFQVSADTNILRIDLMSTAATNDAPAGLTTSAGLWVAANPFLTPGVTNELAVTRVGTNLTVYINGSPLAGTYTNQQAFGEAFCATTSNYMEVGQGWIPSMLNNELWWRERILEARVWGSEVTSNWSSTGSALATATQSETDLEDFSARLQAAIDWLAAEGGGTVRGPSGEILIGSTVNLKPLVSLKGAASPAYTQGRSPLDGISAGPTVLVGAYGMTTNLIQMTAEYANTNLSKVLNNVTSSDLSYYTSYIQGSTIEGIVFDGTMMQSGHAIYVQEMAGWNVRNNVFRGVPGSPVFAVAANAAEISGNKGIGASRGGFVLNYSADMDVGPNNLWGSTRGPVITLANANKNRIKGNHLFNALRARDLQPVADAGTDEFTVIAHNFNTGDIVQFIPDTGATLPAPIDSRVFYWVIRTGDDTFQINSQRDQGAVGGALQDVALDITSAGSGTYWVMLGGVPSNLVIFGSDQNEIVDNTLDQAAQDAVTLYNGDRSTLVGNMLTEYGYNNSTYTNAAAIRFLHGSDTNSVVGNMIGNRFTSSSFGWYGLYFESGSDGTSVGVNSTQPLTIPVYEPSGGNSISPTFYHQIYGDWVFGRTSMATNATTGFLVLPRVGGDNSEDPANDDTFDGVEAYVNSSGGHLRLHVSDLWRGIPYSAVDGRWTFSNTSNGIVAVQVQTAAATTTLTVANDSDTAGQGANIAGRRARGTADARTNLLANDFIFELYADGFSDNGDYNYSVGGLVFAANETFTSTTAGTRAVLSATPNGTVTPVDVLTAYGSGQIKLYDRTSSPSTFREGSIHYRSDEEAFKAQVNTATTGTLRLLVNSGALSYSGGTNVTVTVAEPAHYRATLAATADVYLAFSGHNADATGEILMAVSGGPHDFSFGSGIYKPAATTLPVSLTDGVWNLEWKQRTLSGTNYTILTVLDYD